MKKLNRDMILSSIAGFLLGISLKDFFEPMLYKAMLFISPTVPENFLPMFYSSLICGAIGGFAGFYIYTVWNKNNRQFIKKALIIAIVSIAAFNTTFFLHTSYINYQLGRPITQINNQSKFAPSTMHILSQDSLMVGSKDSSTGRCQMLDIKETSEYIKTIYDEIQNLQEEIYKIPFDSTYTIEIIYKNNKNYVRRSIWVNNEYACERLSQIYGEIKYNVGSVFNKIDEIMNECRTFDKANKEYFSAQWYNAESMKMYNSFIDIKDIDLLFNTMSVSQNYSPNDEEQDFYNNFFRKQPITPQDGDLIALFYSFDMEQYTYSDAAIYDRTKKLIIFKDKNNQLKYVKSDLDTLFL
jgi:hypothetical protein